MYLLLTELVTKKQFFSEMYPIPNCYSDHAGVVLTPLVPLGTQESCLCHLTSCCITVLSLAS